MPVACFVTLYDELFKAHDIPEDVQDDLRAKMLDNAQAFCLCDDCMKWRAEQEE